MLETLRNLFGPLFAPLAALWTGMSPAKRAGLVVVAFAVMGGLWWFQDAMVARSYRPLFTDLSREDAAAVAAQLDQLGVPYRVGDDPTIILVPESRRSATQLQLASAGLPTSGRPGFDVFEDATLASNSTETERVRRLNALIGEIERTIRVLAAVDRAQVLISLPKRSVFLDEEEPAKASVVLSLGGSRELSSEQVRGITHLVASAVETLEPRRVSVMDTSGRVYRELLGADDSGAQLTSEQLKYQKQVEADIVSKILRVVEPNVGFDRIRATVAAKLNWDDGEQTQELFEDDPVPVTTEILEEIAKPAGEQGVAGAVGNLPRQPPEARGIAAQAGRTSTKTTNVIDRVVTRKNLKAGAIQRLSLAVVVDDVIAYDEAGERTRTPRTAEQLETIRELVASAAGVIVDRGDQLTVQNLPFTIFDPLPPTTGGEPELFSPEWFEQYKYFLIAGAVGTVVLIVLVSVLMAVRRKRKRHAAELQAQLAAEEEQRLLAEAESERARLEEEMKIAPLESDRAQALKKAIEEASENNPEMMAHLVRSWMLDHG